MGLHAEWVQGTALQRPYPGGPPPSATEGFNLGEQGQEHQAKIPSFLHFVGSNVEKSAAGSGTCKLNLWGSNILLLQRLDVMILVISCICAHVPMSPRARTSVPDDWLVIKVSESDTDLW